MNALSFDFLVLPGIRGLTRVTNSWSAIGTNTFWRRSKAIDMGLFEPAQAHVLPALESMENTTCKLLVGLSGSKKAKVVLIDDEAAAKSRLETETWLSKGRNLSELVD